MERSTVVATEISEPGSFRVCCQHVFHLLGQPPCGSNLHATCNSRADGLDELDASSRGRTRNHGSQLLVHLRKAKVQGTRD